VSAYWLLENLWAFSVQFAAIAAFTLMLARVSRRAAPRARMALLQIGLLAALCAPLLQVRSGPILRGAALGAVTVETTAAVPARSQTIRPTTLALGVLAAGAALRLGWTLLGLAGLARRRRRSRLVGEECPELLELCGRLGVKAELRAGSPSPVAFGFLRPAVLLPEGLLASGGDALRAVLAHELVHLRRRDWLFVLAEELLLAALWFHPLAWLLVREIRLTREEVVDEQAAQAITGTAGYLDALLAVARLRFQPAQGPGAEFLRERQIARRIATLIRQENPMSRPIQNLLTAACVGALACAAWWAASLSPLQAAPQVVLPRISQSKNVAVSQGAEGLILPRMQSGRSLYSMGALINGVEGEVTLELTLDDAGNVLDARAVSGPLELRQEAVRWALDWRYDTSVQKARTVIATVKFQLPERASQLTLPLLSLPMALEQTDLPVSSLVLRSVQTADLDPPNPALQAKLESYIGRNLAEPDVAEAIHSDVVSATEAGESYKATQVYVAPQAEGAVLLVRRPAPIERAVTENTPKAGRFYPELDGARPPSPPKRIRVGGAVQTSRIVRQVQPSYPALARQARIQGTVKLNVLLTNEGAVQTVEVLSGHPLLIPAAIDAVKQWRYRPTLLNGNPVEVETEVDVNFSLSE
jgi:TonB family protein